jgi:hypothetical protein
MDVYHPLNKPNTSKYFVIKDYYDAGETDVKFCPTGEMWADVLKKPLQGQKFRDMRAFLQNCPWDYDDDTEFQLLMKPKDVASSRECVDEHAKSKTKLKTKQPSQPQATSPTCVSRVTWGPTQVESFFLVLGPIGPNFLLAFLFWWERWDRLVLGLIGPRTNWS